MIRLTTSQDNVSGVARIVAIPVASFRCILVNNLTGKSTLTLYDTRNCIDIETNRSETASDLLQSSDDVDMYVHNVSGKFFSKIIRENGILDLLVRGRWLVFVTDCNGIHRLYGTPDVPLSFSYSEDTGAYKSGSAALSYSFASSQQDPAVVIAYHPL